MKKNKSENIVSQINTNVFFKEFTFTKNEFIDETTNNELEFSDNVIWLDDIFFIYEIKERENNNAQGEVAWFKNKVLNKAVKQVKNTHKYFEKFSEIPIINERGHTKDISEANLSDIQNVIIYSTSTDFDEDYRFIKFYESQSIGLIHLFHSEDYYWVCKYLSTPAEVKEYFLFREELFTNHPKVLNRLPEQYVLGHFFETIDTSIINPRYVENLKNVDSDVGDYDMTHIIDNFNKKIKLISEKTEYYPIIAEIAKLNRAELIEFKKRFTRAIEMCQDEEVDLPYRMYLPRTNCAFVFIPIIQKYVENWKTALTNYTRAQKYDQRAEKCVGVAIFEALENNEKYFEMFWLFIDGEWKFNKEVEEILAKNPPFRDVKTKRLNNRYLK